tara:strand:- start:2511 stop:3251 length:741 start_codon:yes stop_codon:yes gene_type:complete
MKIESGITDSKFSTVEGNLVVTGQISDVYSKDEVEARYQRKPDPNAGIQASDYRTGQVVQRGYGRADGITNGYQTYTAAASNGVNWASADTVFGQYFVEISPVRATITPYFTNSLIVIHWNIFGEPNTHNTGFKIAELIEDESGNMVPTIIRRSGYEGYNRNAAEGLVEYNHYISDFYDADDSSTPRMSNFVYVDKPNSTDERTYTIMFGANGESANTYRLNRAVASTGTNYEYGVSTFWWEEIFQ